MTEDAEVKRVWKQYQAAWCFNIVIAAIAMCVLTIAPVKNPEWPMVLTALWVIFILAGYCEVSDYIKTRRGYLRFRFTEQSR